MMKASFGTAFSFGQKLLKNSKIMIFRQLMHKINKNYAFYKLIIDILTKKGYNINCKNKKWFYNQMKRGGENVR